MNMFKIFNSENSPKTKLRLFSESGAGFTIIELLVVVAIIAVLTGIVLLNVIVYTDRGKTGAIKANISGIQTNAAVLYENSGSYLGLCGIASVNAARSAIIAAGSIALICVVNAANTQYCVCSREIGNANTFCADYTGTRKETTIACTTECPVGGANPGACV